MTISRDELAAARTLALREDRIRAASICIEHFGACVEEARRFRDEEVRALIRQYGPAEAARRSGLSLSTIKLIKGRP
jgi:hypothetical protein